MCILLIPFFLKRFGIKKVMLIAMFAWVLRFGLFGLGNPGAGVWMFILSCIVYGLVIIVNDSIIRITTFEEPIVNEERYIAFKNYLDSVATSQTTLKQP